MKNFPLLVLGFLVFNALILCFENISSSGQYLLYFSRGSGSLFVPMIIMFGLGVLTGIAGFWNFNRMKKQKQQVTLNAEDFDI